MKTCSKCGEVKAVDQFRTGKNQCRVCTNARSKQWSRNNREKQARYREENREKINKQQAEYRRENRDKVNAASAAYRAKNIKELRRKDRERSVRDREKRNEQLKKWRKENPDKVKSHVKKPKKPKQNYTAVPEDKPKRDNSVSKAEKEAHTRRRLIEEHQAMLATKREEEL